MFTNQQDFLSIGGAMNVVDNFCSVQKRTAIPSASTISIRFCVPDLRQPHRWLPAPDLPPQIDPLNADLTVNQAFINPA